MAPLVPPFFSALYKQVASHPQEVALGSHWGDIVANLKGVKADERKWTGITDFLQSRSDDRVEKAELLAFLADQTVMVSAIVKEDGLAPWRDMPKHDVQGLPGHRMHPFIENGRVVDPLDHQDVTLPALAEAYCVPSYEMAVWVQQVRDEILREQTFAFADLARVEVEMAQSQLHDALGAHCDATGKPRLDYSTLAQISLSAPLLAAWDPRSQSPFPEDIDLPTDTQAILSAFVQANPMTLQRLRDAFDQEQQAGARLDALREQTGPVYGPLKMPYGENYREMLLTLPDNLIENGPFLSAHWEEPNVLAHVRLSDHRDLHGQKLLMIEELQSDWHQQGRLGGYGITDGLIPDAPMKSSWHEMAFRRVARLAAEEGYDGVAIASAETVAARATEQEREGLTTFYDRVLPRYAKSFGKPFDATLETRSLASGIQAQVLEVTDGLKEHALSVGFPQFSVGLSRVHDNLSIDHIVQPYDSGEENMSSPVQSLGADAIYDERHWTDGDKSGPRSASLRKHAATAATLAGSAFAGTAAHADVLDSFKDFRRIAREVDSASRSIDRTVQRVGDAIPNAPSTSVPSAPPSGSSNVSPPQAPTVGPPPSSSLPSNAGADNSVGNSQSSTWGPPPDAPFAADVTVPVKPSPPQPSLPNAVIDQKLVGDAAGEQTKSFVQAAGAKIDGLRVPILSPELGHAVETISQIGAATGIVLGSTATAGTLGAAAVGYKAWQAYKKSLGIAVKSAPHTLTSRKFQLGAKQAYGLERSVEKTGSGRNVHRAQLVDKESGKITFQIESEKPLRAREVVAVYHVTIVEEAERSLGLAPSPEVKSGLIAERKRIDTERMFRDGAVSPDAIKSLADHLKGGGAIKPAEAPNARTALQVQLADTIGNGSSDSASVTSLASAIRSLPATATGAHMGKSRRAQADVGI